MIINSFTKNVLQMQGEGRVLLNITTQQMLNCNPRTMRFSPCLTILCDFGKVLEPS